MGKNPLEERATNRCMAGGTRCPRLTKDGNCGKYGGFFTAVPFHTCDKIPLERKVMYRGKSDSDNVWHYGSLLLCYGDDTDGSISYVIHDGDKTIPVVYESIGLFTGVSDKAGTPIFDGDIVNVHIVGSATAFGIVRFGRYIPKWSSVPMLGFYIEWNTGSDTDFLPYDLLYWIERNELIVGGKAFDYGH